MARALPPSLWINEVALDQLGVSTGRPKGMEALPPVTDRWIAVPQRAGALLVPTEAEIGTRQVTVEGVLLAASLTERNTNWDRVKQILMGPDLTVRFTDYPDRLLIRARATVTPEFLGQSGRFSLQFTSASAYLVGTQVEVYTLPNGVQIPLVLGTASSDVSFHLIARGSATPTVYYRDAQGTIQSSLSFALTTDQWAPPDWVEYDGWSGIAYLWHDGAPANIGSALSSDHFIVADPNDGDVAQGPTLQAVNCDCVALIRKAFL